MIIIIIDLIIILLPLQHDYNCDQNDHHDNHTGERVGAGDGDSYCDSEASMDDGSCYDQVMLLMMMILLLLLIMMLMAIMSIITIIIFSSTSLGARQPPTASVTASTSELPTMILI